ncbi:MAG: nuclear transport factor 2 family protein [Robiginitomaculum sp.]|nr:nuclear transport factor 2 family protein [Robiginitomaculum sp.]
MTQNTLRIWHETVKSKDVSKLRSIIHEDAVFRSPFAFKPYTGQDALVFVLTQVIEIFEDFTYHREMISDDERNAFLEFTTKIGDKTLKGIDLITFDEAGLITEFEVMIRPMSALMALAEQMAPRMARLGH